jgi:hypothetical protein
MGTTTETLNSNLNEVPIEVDAICILGRGIEKVSTKCVDTWRPTQYVELPNAQGGHSGRRTPGVHLNDKVSLIAGAHANVVAACHLFQELRDKDLAPRIVVFAAGRPSYLSDEPDQSLTEGRVLSEYFVRKIRPRPRETEIIVFDHNLDTQDDIRAFLSLATERQIGRAVVVTVKVHIPRAIEFAKQARRQNANSVAMAFLSSEEILARRYAQRNAILKTLSHCEASGAYKRTLAREIKGIAALRAGQYKRSGG